METSETLHFVLKCNQHLIVQCHVFLMNAFVYVNVYLYRARGLLALRAGEGEAGAWRWRPPPS